MRLTVNISGTYSGRITWACSGSANATGTIVQTGNRYSGTFVTAEGSSASVEGIVMSNSFVTINATSTSECWGNYEGTATLLNNGDTMTGSYSGCGGEGFIFATFTLNRR